ncbi:MAG: C39 family peptidase [Patescibacteria group bacterium]|jgi:hypothetical protein
MKKQYYLILGLFLVVLAGCGRTLPKAAEDQVAGQNLPDFEAINAEEAVNEADLAAELKAGVKKVINDGVEVVAEKVAEVETPPTAGLPATFDQAMAFSRQAPFGQWSNPFYEDACEEASLIMAQKFFQGAALDESIMKVELDKVAPWELEKFGENLSVDTEEVAIMAREYFGLNAEVSAEVTVEKIKKELVAGNIIILPLTGQDIGNPNYSGAGPLYHMLVVKGYDRDQFITNDPGTRLGKDYKYEYQTLIDATHDWNGGEIYNGEKVMIIVKKM